MIDKKAISAYRKGIITKEEFDYYHKTNDKQKIKLTPRRKITLALAIILIINIGIWLAASIFFGGMTGAVIGTQDARSVNLLFNEDGFINLNATNVTSISVSGMLKNGEATIFTKDGKIVYQGSTINNFTTNKEKYALNEEILLTINADQYSLWLNYENGNKLPVNEPLTINDPGDYVLDAIINNSNNISKESVSLTVLNTTNITNETRNNNIVFTNVCKETCNIPATSDINLTIQLTEGAELIINSISLTFDQVNQAPVQTINIPNINLLNETIINLDNYFVDQDNDNLIYEINNIIGVEESINDNLLTLKGTIPGTYETTIYASDSKALTQSNEFIITVPEIVQDNLIENVTNSSNLTLEINHEDTDNEPIINNTNESLTINESLVNNENNISTNINVSNTTATNITTNKTITTSCDNPDPNLRAQECFIGKESEFFDERFDFTIENKNRVAVARFNSLGNLLIKGDIIEYSTSTPKNNNFVVGYSKNFNFIPTVWIDDDNNLNLKGALYEEQINLIIPSNSYSFQGLSGINLGYINPRTGDFYIRGNLIPYRRKI